MENLEMQGPDTLPGEYEDEVYVRDEEGNLIKLEVPDDAEND